VGVFLALVYDVGHRSGEKAVQVRWDASTLKIAQDQNRLLQDNAKNMADLVEKQKAATLAVEEDHAKAIDAIRQKYDSDIAAVRAAGGLRLPRSVCSSPGTQATGTGGSHEDPAATIVLPATTTDDLFDFARQADEVTETARTCQNWIRANQFYGASTPTQ
jgi:hypothetical protein